MSVFNSSLFLKLLFSFASTGWLSIYILKAFPDPQGTDFFPLYSATVALINGNDLYSVEFSDWLAHFWEVPKTRQVASIIAYPLPFLVAISPIAYFPLHLAVPIWSAISVFMVTQIARLSKHRLWAILALMSFYPLFHALVIKTSSVIWIGIAGCSCVLIERKQHPILLGIFIAMLPLKPQAGLVFFIFAIVSIYKTRNTPALASAFLVSFILWGIAFAVDPDWISKWVHNIGLYKKHAVTNTLLPLGLIVLLLAARISLLSFISVAQVVLFPVNDIYSTLPLVIAMMKFKGFYQISVPIISLLLGFLMDFPNSTLYLWVAVLLPFSIFSVIVTHQNK